MKEGITPNSHVQNKVAQQGDYSIIEDLCKIADDDICEVSAGQYLIDVIVGIVEKEKYLNLWKLLFLEVKKC